MQSILTVKKLTIATVRVLLSSYDEKNIFLFIQLQNDLL